MSREGEDARLRMRLAEALSSAGVDSGRIAIEVLFLLPAEFVRGYSELFHRALVTGEEGRGGADERKATLGRAAGKRTAEGRGAARRQKGGRGIFVVGDERALGEKERIDRGLRKMAREMKKGDGSGGWAVYKCGKMVGEGGEDRKGCGRWVEAGWKYCPNCGVEQG